MSENIKKGREKWKKIFILIYLEKNIISSHVSLFLHRTRSIPSIIKNKTTHFFLVAPLHRKKYIKSCLLSFLFFLELCNQNEIFYGLRYQTTSAILPRMDFSLSRWLVLIQRKSSKKLCDVDCIQEKQSKHHHPRRHHQLQERRRRRKKVERILKSKMKCEKNCDRFFIRSSPWYPFPISDFTDERLGIMMMTMIKIYRTLLLHLYYCYFSEIR